MLCLQILWFQEEHDIWPPLICDVRWVKDGGSPEPKHSWTQQNHMTFTETRIMTAPPQSSTSAALPFVLVPIMRDNRGGGGGGGEAACRQQWCNADSSITLVNPCFHTNPDRFPTTDQCSRRSLQARGRFCPPPLPPHIQRWQHFKIKHLPIGHDWLGEGEPKQRGSGSPPLPLTCAEQSAAEPERPQQPNRNLRGPHGSGRTPGLCRSRVGGHACDQVEVRHLSEAHCPSQG